MLQDKFVIVNINNNYVKCFSHLTTSITQFGEINHVCINILFFTQVHKLKTWENLAPEYLKEIMQVMRSEIKLFFYVKPHDPNQTEPNLWNWPKNRFSLIFIISAGIILSSQKFPFWTFYVTWKQIFLLEIRVTTRDQI